MISVKKAKKLYEQYLNNLGESLERDSFWWIKDGRPYDAETYGTQLKRHDPIAFEVGFNEWKLTS